MSSSAVAADMCCRHCRLNMNALCTLTAFASPSGLFKDPVRRGRETRCRDLKRIFPVASRRRIVVELPRPLGLVLEEAIEPGAPRSSRSVVVSSVGAGSPASGLVQVGDVIVATSATFGDGTWPTRSLDGAVCAIRSRCGDTVKLVLEREEDSPSSVPIRIAPPPPRPVPPRRRPTTGSPTASLFTNTSGGFDSASPPSESMSENFESDVLRSEANAPAVALERQSDSDAIQNFDELLTEFTKFRAKRVAEELIPCAIEAVREYATAPNPRVADIVSLVYRLKRAEAPLSLKFYNNLMWSYVKAKHPQRAMDVFDDLPNPNVECYTTMAKAFSMLKRPDDALALLPVMRARGVAPNIHMYNAVIASCVRAGSLRKARDLFSEMLTDHVQPNVVSWNIIINWHAQHKKGSARLAGITQAFADMKNSGIKANAVTFTTMMKAYAASGAINKAEGIFAEMKKRFPVIQVDTEAYNTLLSAHSSRLDWRRCLELLDEMQDRSRYKRNSESLYNEEDNGFGRDGGSSSVSSSTNVLSNETERVSDDFRRNSPFNRMYKGDKERGEPILEADPVTYSLVIKGCADAGRVRVAQAVFDEMLQAGISPPPAHAVMSLLNGYARSGDFTRGLEMLKQLKRWGISPNLRMMSALMHASIKAGEADLALSIYSKIKASSIKPDVVAYTLLLRAYGLKGEIDKALNILKGMLREHSYALPNVVTYNTMIECARENNRLDVALRVLNMLLHNEHGVRLDANTFRSLVVKSADINEESDVARDGMSSLDNINAGLTGDTGAFDDIGTGDDHAEWETNMSAGHEECFDKDLGDKSSALVTYGSKKYLKYLLDARQQIRDAGFTANGILYVALLETCEQLKEWDVGMNLVAERDLGQFHVGRSSAAEARLFEEAFKKRVVKF